MKKQILKLGRNRLVLAITVTSTLMALVSDFTIAKVLGHNITPAEDLLRAAIIPFLIAPFVSWYLVGFLFELDKLEKKMSTLATFDDLTGAYNRRAFLKICESQHSYSLRKNEHYCLLMIDFDHFKKINDEYGHTAGDNVLASFGKISKELSRNSDVLGRLGGEEFAFFLPDTNVQQAREFAHRLQSIIKKTSIVFEGSRIKYTISIGIFMNFSNNEISLEEGLQKADKALYLSKKNGRNQISVFSS
jgi:diguanylate cyclase (GGDEF)-like protein